MAHGKCPIRLTVIEGINVHTAVSRITEQAEISRYMALLLRIMVRQMRSAPELEMSLQARITLLIREASLMLLAVKLPIDAKIILGTKVPETGCCQRGNASRQSLNNTILGMVGVAHQQKLAAMRLRPLPDFGRAHFMQNLKFFTNHSR